MTRLLTMLLALLVLAPLGAVAHGGEEHDDAVAAELARYPELVIRVTDAAIEGPGEVAAGRYHLIQVNDRTGEEAAHFFLLRVPDYVTEEELAKDPGDEDPPWFEDAVFWSNPDRAQPNGGRSEGIVDLDAGRYLIIDPLSPELMPERLIVGGGESATPGAIPSGDAPAADVTATMREMTFDMPATVPAGRQLWEVTNTGAMGHELSILPVPAGATPETTTQAILALFEGNEPATVGPAWAGWAPVEPGGVGVTSPRRTAWVALDLEPGTYAAVCFFPGGTGQPHILDGMIRIFTAGDGRTAPVAGPAAAGVSAAVHDHPS